MFQTWGTGIYPDEKRPVYSSSKTGWSQIKIPLYSISPSLTMTAYNIVPPFICLGAGDGFTLQFLASWLLFITTALSHRWNILTSWNVLAKQALISIAYSGEGCSIIASKWPKRIIFEAWKIVLSLSTWHPLPDYFMARDWRVWTFGVLGLRTPFDHDDDEINRSSVDSFSMS
jgi:hypothetical protein